MTNREVVSSFLAAYQAHDYVRMHSCLDGNAKFSDLAFQRITGADVRAMWHWFCVRTESREHPVSVLSFEILNAAADHVEARYQVDYTLERRHKVNYVIQSDFTLRDGRIVRQVDEPTISNFEFAKMALGFPKCLLALTPWFQRILRRQMSGKLADFRSSQSGARAAAASAR